ncbi:hypothetical protein ABC426_17270 [Lactiplantibacillus plantarum]|uniref:hypothetical protein n=1 Tax=Lactiplantibacillus plantarum TaxID=1590 RepID=UPI001BA8C157|nr:hypothetical protein [Lactiplantibacillus plantarum]MBS0953363.1 hypothetical protein [Lactiplantibacillus plantarum]
MKLETTKLERKLLKQLIQVSNSKHIVAFDKINMNAGNYEIGLLHLAGLVSFTDTDDWGANPKSIQVTEDGLHFFDWRRENTRTFIKEHIVTPVTVSIATTLITLLLTKLLGLLW